MNIATQVSIPRQGETETDAATEPAALGAGPLAAQESLGLRNRVFERVFGGGVEPVRIGRYRILERLGRGAMGVVYAAYDNQLDRKIAVKLLHRTRSGVDDGQQRLLREAQALARLSHPNVVQVFDVGDWEGRVFVAMEFVRGRTVREWREEKPPGWRRVLSTFVAAGRGLAAAHAEGIVHRDFKPDNVLVSDAGVAKVVDFGLAAAEAAAPRDPEVADRDSLLDHALTETGLVMGTPAYMAPEQFVGGAIDERADQFAFCVAAYETLWGRRPYRAETFEELAAAVAKGPDEPPRDHVPAGVRQALLRGLSADPADRFANIGELLGTLEAASSKKLGTSLIVLIAGVILAAIGAGAAMSTGMRSSENSALTERIRSEEDRAKRLEEELEAKAFEIEMDPLEKLRQVDPTQALRRLVDLDPRAMGSNRARALLAKLAVDWTADEIHELGSGIEPRLATTTRLVVTPLEGEPAIVWAPDPAERKTLAPEPLSAPFFGDCVASRRGREVTLWRAPDFEPEAFVVDTDPREVSIADGCEHVAVHQGRRVTVIHANSGARSVLDAPGAAGSFDLPYPSPDGERVAIVDDDGRLGVLEAGRSWLHPADVVSGRVAWAPDGSRLATTSEHGDLLVFDAHQLERPPMREPLGFRDATFAGDANHLVAWRVDTDSGASVRSYAIADGGLYERTLVPLPFHSQGWLTSSPDGTSVVVRHGTQGTFLVDLELAVAREIKTKQRALLVAFDPEGGLWSAHDGTVLRWPEPPGPQWTTKHEERVVDLRFAGSDAVSLRADGTVRLGLDDRAPVLPNPEGPERRAFFGASNVLGTSSTGVVALAQTSGITLWRNGQPERLPYPEPVVALDVSPDGRHLAVLTETSWRELDLAGDLSHGRDLCPGCALFPQHGTRYYDGAHAWAMSEDWSTLYTSEPSGAARSHALEVKPRSRVATSRGRLAWVGVRPGSGDALLAVFSPADGRTWSRGLVGHDGSATKMGFGVASPAAMLGTDRVIHSVGSTVVEWNTSTDEVRELLRTDGRSFSLLREAPDGSVVLAEEGRRIWTLNPKSDADRLGDFRDWVRRVPADGR